MRSRFLLGYLDYYWVICVTFGIIIQTDIFICTFLKNVLLSRYIQDY